MFQSTPPARGATQHAAAIKKGVRVSIHAPRAGGDALYELHLDGILDVSIHAPRAGGDSDFANAAAAKRCFNPRPPRGGRRSQQYLGREIKKFQSTPPARGATWNPLLYNT